MKTLDDARAEARDKHRFASPYRVGIQVALLGVRCANPYQEGSRGWHLFENGLEYGRRRAALPTPSVVKQSLTATQTGEKGESDE